MAIFAYGDRRPIVASRSLFEVLSQILNDGDPNVFVHALSVFALIILGWAQELRDAVHTKIPNDFVARNQQVPITSASRGCKPIPALSESLRSIANNPASFTNTVDAWWKGCSRPDQAGMPRGDPFDVRLQLRPSSTFQVFHI